MKIVKAAVGHGGIDGIKHRGTCGAEGAHSQNAADAPQREHPKSNDYCLGAKKVYRAAKQQISRKEQIKNRRKVNGKVGEILAAFHSSIGKSRLRHLLEHLAEDAEVKGTLGKGLVLCNCAEADKQAKQAEYGHSYIQGRLPGKSDPLQAQPVLRRNIFCIQHKNCAYTDIEIQISRQSTHQQQAVQQPGHQQKPVDQPCSSRKQKACPHNGQGGKKRPPEKEGRHLPHPGKVGKISSGRSRKGSTDKSARQQGEKICNGKSVSAVKLSKAMQKCLHAAHGILLRCRLAIFFEFERVYCNICQKKDQ